MLPTVRHFFHNYEVRYDDCNLYGLLTPAAALCFMQDIAERDAKDGQLIAAGGNWIARRTVAEFRQPVEVRATLETETFPGAFSKVTAMRNYEIRDISNFREGDKRPDPAIKARTLWVYLDERGKPARIPAVFQEVWLPNGPVSAQEEAAWPDFPETPDYITSGQVRFSDLDVLGHMNNTAYVQMMDNAGWEALNAVGLLPDPDSGQLLPQNYDIEYHESAKAGETLQVHSWFQPILDDGPGRFERLQQVRRDDRLLLRARSVWQWQSANPDTLDLLKGLWS